MGDHDALHAYFAVCEIDVDSGHGGHISFGSVVLHKRNASKTALARPRADGLASRHVWLPVEMAQVKLDGVNAAAAASSSIQDSFAKVLCGEPGPRSAEARRGFAIERKTECDDERTGNLEKLSTGDLEVHVMVRHFRPS